MITDPKKYDDAEAIGKHDDTLTAPDSRKTVPDVEPQDDILREKEDTGERHRPNPDDYTGGPDKPTA